MNLFYTFVEFFVVAQFLIKAKFQHNCDNLYSFWESDLTQFEFLIMTIQKFLARRVSDCPFFTRLCERSWQRCEERPSLAAERQIVLEVKDFYVCWPFVEQKLNRKYFEQK